MRASKSWVLAGAAAMTCAAAMATIGYAAEPIELQPGLYEVEVRLELPHLDDSTSKKSVRRCLGRDVEQLSYGLAVLSDNNPLAACPISNVREAGGATMFDIVCAGRNAGHAQARYVLAPAAFQGRITMQMGGKNMTMTEVQSGRKIGACTPADR